MFVFFCYVSHRDSKHPEPPPGTRWKEVRHDNKVTWLVSWTENIQGSIKYIMLNPSSRIKVDSSRCTLTDFNLAYFPFNFQQVHFNFFYCAKILLTIQEE